MATIRLDVNLFNAKDDSVKRTNCVPLKDFDISSKKLSDVRSVLIENGGLDASKYVYCLCSLDCADGIIGSDVRSAHRLELWSMMLRPSRIMWIFYLRKERFIAYSSYSLEFEILTSSRRRRRVMMRKRRIFTMSTSTLRAKRPVLA